MDPDFFNGLRKPHTVRGESIQIAGCRDQCSLQPARIAVEVKVDIQCLTMNQPQSLIVLAQSNQPAQSVGSCAQAVLVLISTLYGHKGWVKWNII